MHRQRNDIFLIRWMVSVVASAGERAMLAANEHFVVSHAALCGLPISGTELLALHAQPEDDGESAQGHAHRHTQHT